jgi:2'-5' RNA ligase
MTLRTFFAVELSPEVRSRAAELIGQLASSPTKVSWVRPENLHLTVKFLGETPEELVGLIGSAVTEAVATLPAFGVRCGGLGAFPNLGRPRTIWIGLREGQAEMARLHDAIDRCTHKLRFPREGRKFQSHLTVGRVRGGRDLGRLSAMLRERSEREVGSMRVTEVTLFSSQLGPAGAVYTSLGRFPLAGH